MPHDEGVGFNKIGLNFDARRSRSGSCGRLMVFTGRQNEVRPRVSICGASLVVCRTPVYCSAPSSVVGQFEYRGVAKLFGLWETGV